MIFVDRRDLGRAGRDRGHEHRVGIRDGQDHPYLAAVDDRARLVLDPELGAVDRQLRHHHLAAFGEPFELYGSECGLVVLGRLRRVVHREPRCDARHRELLIGEPVGVVELGAELVELLAVEQQLLVGFDFVRVTLGAMETDLVVVERRRIVLVGRLVVGFVELVDQLVDFLLELDRQDLRSSCVPPRLGHSRNSLPFADPRRTPMTRIGRSGRVGAAWDGHRTETHCGDASPSSRARRVARGGASPRRWAKPARRSSAPGARRARQRSEYDRAETIEETAELVTELGGTGIAIARRPSRPRAGAASRRADPERLRPHRRARQRHLGRRDAEGRPRRVEHADLGARPRHRAAHPPARDRHPPHHVAPPAAAAHRQPGGLLVEVTDGTNDYNASTYRISVFYDLAKVAVNRLAFSQGHELAPHGATAVAITPGLAALGDDARRVRRVRGELARRDAGAAPPGFALSESPRYVGRAVAALAADPDRERWNQQSVTSGQLAREYGFTDIDGSQPDVWRYIADTGDSALQVNLDDYR